MADSLERVQFDRECWFAKRLGTPHMFATGVTTTAQRLQLLATTIKQEDLTDETVGKIADTPQTWREAFERAFAITLEDAAHVQLTLNP